MVDGNVEDVDVVVAVIIIVYMIVLVYLVSLCLHSTFISLVSSSRFTQACTIVLAPVLSYCSSSSCCSSDGGGGDDSSSSSSLKYSDK